MPICSSGQLPRGRSFPSRSSSDAPPPLERDVILSAKPNPRTVPVIRLTNCPSSRMAARGFWPQVSKQDTWHQAKAQERKLERDNHRDGKKNQCHDRSNSSHPLHPCRHLLLHFRL